MFLSTATNSLDQKGRISVPADFRAVIAHANRDDPNFDGVVIWRSLDGNCLEGGGLDLMQSYSDKINALSPFDPRRKALERVILGGSKHLSLDATGRITLPKELAEYANLSGRATFVGMGSRFEIWNPERFDAQNEAALKLARESAMSLDFASTPPSSLGGAS